MVRLHLPHNVCGCFQGITIFRMQRNDEFLRNMLYYVSIFYGSHVKPGIPPNVNFFSNLPGYAGFLQLSLKIARGTPAVVHIAYPAKAPACDRRAFLG